MKSPAFLEASKNDGYITKTPPKKVGGDQIYNQT